MTQKEMAEIQSLSTLKFLACLKDIGNTTTKKRLIRERCRRDVPLFARYFFPHHCRLPFNALHRDLFSFHRRLINGSEITRRQGRKLALAAPRGSAKSTLTSLILPIHSIVYGLERYIVIISATMKQASQRLKNIKAEIADNERLTRIYGAFDYTKRNWNVKSINVNGVQVDVFSAGMEIRGITYQQFRPTRVILDDAEDSEAVESADQREKLAQWFGEVIENLGDTYTVLQMVGTLLHPESLLARILRRPDFTARTYRSIATFSDAAALWNEWKALYTNLADEARQETARAFFNARRNDMVAGTSVLWNAKEDYYELMCQLTTRGRRAFFKEKQNDPRSSDSKVFDLEQAAFFTLEREKGTIEMRAATNSSNAAAGADDTKDARAMNLADLKIVGFLDSATGRQGSRRKNDFAAIATVGFDARGYKYLLDVWVKRAAPTAQIAAIFDLHQAWRYDLFGIETNCFQELLLLPLEEERKRRKRAGDAWALPIEEVHHSQKKETRILSLEPLTANGWLRFNRDLPEELFRQMEDFPRGLHDDAIDALEGAVSLAARLTFDHTPAPRRKSVRAMKNF